MIFLLYFFVNILFSISILGLSFEGNILAKLLLIAKAAYHYCSTYERDDFRSRLRKQVKELGEIETVKGHIERLKRLQQLYRQHPIRRKMREFVLQQPEVLAHSLTRYNEGIEKFQSRKGITKRGMISWKLLNRLIHVPKLFQTNDILPHNSGDESSFM